MAALSLDWIAVDTLLERAYVSWRDGLARLRRDVDGVDANPLAEGLAGAPSAEELADFADPLANALASWRRELDRERDDWWAQRELWSAWQTPRGTPHAAPTSLLTARRDWMGARDDATRDRVSALLVHLAAQLGDRELDTLERRADGHGGPFPPLPGVPREHLVAMATRFIERTADAAAETMARGWCRGYAASLGRAANEGWPARLTGRWLAEVLGPGGLGEGLRPRAPALPRVIGSTSFALALGNLGVALLESARPRTVPWCLHRLPGGSRHPTRFALLASVTTTPPFASRILGLGRERARSHQRAMSAGLLASLRLTAMGVLIADALGDGKQAARERAADLGQRIVGEAPPSALVAVLPRLRPDDGGRLVGALLAHEQHLRLVERHDVDWLWNPRAASELRDDDARVEEPLELDEPRRRELVDDLVQTAEAQLA